MNGYDYISTFNKPKIKGRTTMGRPNNKNVAKTKSATKNSNTQKTVTKNNTTANNTPKDTAPKSSTPKKNVTPVAKNNKNNVASKNTKTPTASVTNKSPRGRKATKDLEATLKGAAKTKYTKVEQTIIELENNKRKAINDLNIFLNKSEFNINVYDNLKRKNYNERNNIRRQAIRNKNSK